MISKPVKILILALLLIPGAAYVVIVRFDNRQLRGRVATLRSQGTQVARLKDSNRRTRDLLARAEANSVDGGRAIQAEIAHARTAVAELEERARAAIDQTTGQATRDAENLVDNRDPEKGLTRLEHFRDVGNASPAAAFQTLVWAALKGENERLDRLITFDDEGRGMVAETIATLPEADRTKFSTPEKVAALFFGAEFTGLPAIEIVQVEFQDDRRGTVSVRGMREGISKLSMQRGEDGWQFAVPAGFAARLGEWAKRK